MKNGLCKITREFTFEAQQAQSAQDHRAQTPGEPRVKGATEKDKTRQLPAEQALWATRSSLKDSQSQGGESTDGQDAIGGGTGSTAAWSRPDLVIAAPGGITQSSAQSGFYSAGGTTSVIAGQDLNQLSAANTALAAKDGIVLYTYGKAQNGQKPNAETGIKLHAASGNVNMQSQSDATHIIADKAVQVSSTNASINVSSPTHILLTAGGAGIKISGGNITLSAPGSITFKAGMKNLTGGASASAGVSLNKVAALNLPKQNLLVTMLDADGQSPSGEALTLQDGTGKEHLLSVTAGGAIAAAFKPGSVKARQAGKKQ